MAASSTFNALCRKKGMYPTAIPYENERYSAASGGVRSFSGSFAFIKVLLPFEYSLRCNCSFSH